MTPRERYLEALLFGRPDRVPFSPGGPRESTLKAWHAQGLPEGKSYMTAIYEELGLTPEKTMPPVHPGVSFRMIPTFEEKVLDHRDGTYVVQDWMGATTVISDQYDYTYIRNAKDFVTRHWLKWPVESRADWEEKIKWRYNLDDPGRFPPDFDERCRKARERDYVLTIGFNGPFWQLREWCGFEGLCLFLLDDPRFVRDMVTFWTEFVAGALGRILERVTPDVVHLSEDMAYKVKAMISPAMTREFLKPAYDAWVSAIKTAGCPIVAMDSDGYIGELIPVWIDAGMNVCDPIEVAAGNDINKFRRKFRRKMAYRGGIDKRALAKGGDEMEAELMRVRPVIEGGGYIPGCDHGVPPDISWANFRAYCRRLAQLTGWL